MKPSKSSACGDISGSAPQWSSDCNENGGQIQTAALKFKFGEMFSAKAGYFQPSVATGLGVNWSFAASTYRGGQVGAKFGALSLGVVYADEHRVPWYKDTYEFRESDNKTDAGNVYSVGAVYSFTDAISLDIAGTGITKGDRKN